MDELGVLWMPSNNYFSGRGDHQARWLILHGTGGFNSAEEVGHYFQTSEASTHYTIGRDGAIVQSVREQDSAWGNGGVTAGHDPWWSIAVNPNYLTISIEHVKPHTDNSDLLTELQVRASFHLIAHICARHNIPRCPADANGGITGHCSMDPIYRSYCPGPYPWNKLFAFLNQDGQHPLSVK